MAVVEGMPLVQLPKCPCPPCQVGYSVYTITGDRCPYCLTQGVLWDLESLVPIPDHLLQPYLCKFSVIRALGDPFYLPGNQTRLC